MTALAPFRLGQSLEGSPKAAMRANTCCECKVGLWRRENGACYFAEPWMASLI